MLFVDFVVSGIEPGVEGWIGWGGKDQEGWDGGQKGQDPDTN